MARILALVVAVLSYLVGYSIGPLSSPSLAFADLIKGIQRMRRGSIAGRGDYAWSKKDSETGTSAAPAVSDEAGLLLWMTCFMLLVFAMVFLSGSVSVLLWTRKARRIEETRIKAALLEMKSVSSQTHQVKSQEAARPESKSVSCETDPTEPPEALLMPDLLVEIFKYLGFKDRLVMKEVHRKWKGVLESSRAKRRITWDKASQTVTLRNHLYAYKYSHSFTQCLSTLAVHLPLLGDVSFLYTLLPSVMRRDDCANLKRLILFNGSIEGHKLEYFLTGMPKPPRIYLRIVNVCSMVILPVLAIHVRVVSALLDPRLMKKVDSVEERLEEPRTLLRNVLIGVLEVTPLKQAETQSLQTEYQREKQERKRRERKQDILLKSSVIAARGEEWVRDWVRAALTRYESGLFGPATTKADWERIQLTGHNLKNSTVHILRILVKVANRKGKLEYCTDTSFTCCAKKVNPVLPEFLFGGS